MEEEIMTIILNAGDARSKCLLALKSARKGEFEKAKEQLKQVSQSMILAHNVQTRLIQKEMTGEKHQVSLLMVHAQDHLMTAMAIRDMVEEMVAYAEELNKKWRKDYDQENFISMFWWIFYKYACATHERGSCCKEFEY